MTGNSSVSTQLTVTTEPLLVGRFVTVPSFTLPFQSDLTLNVDTNFRQKVSSENHSQPILSAITSRLNHLCRSFPKLLKFLRIPV